MAQSNGKLPGKIVDISYNFIDMTVKLDMGVGIGGDKWPAADKFCNFITSEKYKNFFADLFCDKRCIELGGGNAIVGILMDKAFKAKDMVITDLESHVDHMQSNIDLNKCGSSCEVSALDWKVNTVCENKYDFIFALECVYKIDLFLPLINTIKNCSHSKTVTFLGLTRDFANPRFFELLVENGFHYRKLPDDVYDANSDGLGEENVGLFVLYQR